MQYFNISNGLRGCYMPDSAHIIRCNTRRELKRALEDEAYYLRDAGFTGASKRAVASLAAEAWRDAQQPRKKWGDFVCPLKPHGSDNASYGLFVSHSTRADYLASMETE